MLWLLAACTALAPLPVAGAGQVELVPPEALPLGGYTDRRGASFEPGGETLWARARVIERGPVRVAVVVADLLTIPESLRREVAARLPSNTRLFLVASHTHCAPDSQMLNDRMTMAIPGIASFRARWLTWYADAIARSVPPSQTSGAFELGVARLGLNRGRRPGAWPSTRAVRLWAGADCLITHYAAHPTLYGPDMRRLSGDWPGAVAANAGGIVLNGALGDVSPNPLGVSAADSVARFAREFRGAAWRRTRLEGDLGWAEAPIVLDPPSAHPEFARANSVPEPLAKIAVERFAPREAKIAAWRLGKLAVVGVPGEPTSAVGRRIEAEGRKVGFETVLVVSHANGWIGYILEADDYARGGYEAQLAFHGPAAADRVVEACRVALGDLARRQRTSNLLNAMHQVPLPAADHF